MIPTGVVSSSTASASPPDALTLTASGGGIAPVYDEYGEYILYYAASYVLYTPYTNNNGSTITSTTLQASFDLGATWSTWSTKSYPNGTNFDVSIQQDDNNDPYWFRAFHTNAAGNGPVSNTINLST